MIPPIEPYIKDLKFRFNATGMVQYSLNFQSSNETIMRHPTTTIRPNGLVPRKTKAFRVKFPCTGKVTGRALLTINISFVDVAGSEIWGPLSLTLKRQCVADKEGWIKHGNSSEVSPLPPPQICNKRCSKRHVMRRFCLSDFVIKARMESEIMRNGLPRLRVRIVRMYKQGKVSINSRSQLLDKRGQEITCSCSNLKANRVYLILGKEDKRRRVLYLDNFSTALEWSKNGRSYVRAYKKKASCPERRSR
ncbi:Wnt inhibitory factor 1 [Desmophyllum pertusum]|uniref:Wnt inhibitory factor 1 n=1 Tax=Desmophyllum pertusum TaxID=174260 RepID=A0A9W9ZWX3_9CNID|nr:Wnt inhibitory factor 1 [Desmophyllum pertusum]